MTASSDPSPSLSPLEDDDLLTEILLRLPPDPSSLPRASLVCTRWHRLITDPRFRCRLRHHLNPPLLGFFDGSVDMSFLPTLESPNRVPRERFSLQHDDDGDRVRRTLGCRHGLVLVFIPKRPQVLVWDPITGDQHRVDVPPGFATNHRDRSLINGAVLRSAQGVQHFQVVLVVADGDGIQHRLVIACVYSSETGVWGSFISTPIPYEADGSSVFARFSTIVCTDHAVLAGNSLYWQLIGNIDGILQFDLEKQRLAVIRVPVSMYGYGQGNCFKVMPAEGGGLGFLFMSEPNYTIQLWRREIDSDGVAKWVLGRSIELDKLLSLNLGKEDMRIVGFAEQNNVLLLNVHSRGLFMIQLDSLQFKKIPGVRGVFSCCHAFEGFYAAGNSLLHNPRITKES